MKQNGLTLLEVLVALIIVGIVISIFSYYTNTSIFGNKRSQEYGSMTNRVNQMMQRVNIVTADSILASGGTLTLVDVLKGDSTIATVRQATAADLNNEVTAADVNFGFLWYVLIKVQYTGTSGSKTFKNFTTVTFKR